MKAMILAAGRGERMRPLTDRCPKPLLEVVGAPLIEHHINKLARAGFREIVINHAYLGEQIENFLQDGSRYGVSIQYSREHEALETGGGIYQALQYLGDAPFLVVNGDVWCEFDYTQLPTTLDGLVHLVMIDNPEHNPDGDFYYDNHRLTESTGIKLTYSGLGIYRAALFDGCKSEKFPLAPLLRQSIKQGQASATYFKGFWLDVGTPERLNYLNQYLS